MRFVKNSGSIDINLPEFVLGVLVIPISVAKNEDINELIEHAVRVTRYGIQVITFGKQFVRH